MLARSDLPTYITSTLPAHDPAKLSVIQHPDFKSYSLDLLSRDGIKDAASIIWALGVSQTDVKGEKYVEITHDYTLRAAEAFKTLDKPPRFVFLSGHGATQE